MKAAGAKLLVVEAGKTILVDQREFIELANREQIVVVALESAASAGDIAHDQAARPVDETIPSLSPIRR
jgi:hypothetical protein